MPDTNPSTPNMDDTRDVRDPLVMRRPHVIPFTPIPARHDDLVRTLDCHDATAFLLERYGRANVARSLLCYFDAQGQDLHAVTLDALAQGEERL